jgi:hypothetical protein
MLSLTDAAESRRTNDGAGEGARSSNELQGPQTMVAGDMDVLFASAVLDATDSAVPSSSAPAAWSQEGAFASVQPKETVTDDQEWVSALGSAETASSGTLDAVTTAALALLLTTRMRHAEWPPRIAARLHRTMEFSFEPRRADRN